MSNNKCSSSNSKIIKKRKNNINIVHKLHNRQTNNSKTNCKFKNFVFEKHPVRFFYNLRKIVQDGGNDVDDGYVFLGYTRDSNWVLSYTCSIEMSTDVFHITYSFKLQWWKYIPNKPLKLEKSIRLFNDDEITGPLLIRIYQWRNCDDKIMIQGETNMKQKCCYVTITAVPSLGLCSDCVYKPCIKHSFSVHSKYDVAPPYHPPSLHTAGIPGVALLHSGDILHSLNVNVEEFFYQKPAHDCEFEYSGKPSPRVQHSPAYSQTDVNSSLCSSCMNQVSKVHEITSDLGCLTKSVRRFTFDKQSSAEVGDNTGDNNELPFDIEDDITMQYHTVLPVDVRVDKIPLKLLDFNPQQNTKVLTVKHLSLDFEHLIGEIIRFDSELSSRFIALLTYDVCILYVQEETMSVFLLIYCLFKARKPGALCIKQHGEESYSSRITLEWSLLTGTHIVHSRSHLEKFNGDEASFRGKNINFNGPPKSEPIIVMDNEPVFKVKSVGFLRDQAGIGALIL